MSAEYISITEFARRDGCSRQAVYARLKTSLKEYVKVIDGQKCIDISALTTHLKGKTDKAIDTKNTVNGNDLDLNETLEDLHKIEESSREYSGEALQALTEIIKDQTKQINHLQTQLQEERAHSRQLADNLAEIAKGALILNQQKQIEAARRRWWQFWKVDVAQG